MCNWNKTAKIKSIIILFFSFCTLFSIDFGLNHQRGSEFYFVVIILYFIFFSIFFPFLLKFWNLFGFTFERPNWNENFLTVKFSKWLNFFHFFGILLIVNAFLSLFFILVFSELIEYGYFYQLFAGIFILLGIEIYLKIQKSKNPTI